MISKALRRFLVGYVVLQLLATLLFVWVLTRVARDQMMSSAREKMKVMALMLREQINQSDAGIQEPDLADHIQALGEESSYRFTLFTGDGKVVADSETGTRDVGSQNDRPEIVKAKTNGVGFSQRQSETLDLPMLYLAVPVNDKESNSTKDSGLVRVGISSVSINRSIASLQKYTTLFVVGLSTLTGILILWFSNRAMRPLSNFADAARSVEKGSYQRISGLNQRNDEWGELADAFNQMQHVLSQRELGLKEDSSRLEAVLSSMIEGVIALDSVGEVKMANNAACQMFSMIKPELIGRKLINILRFPELIEAIETTMQNRVFSDTEFTTVGETRNTIRAQVSILDVGDEKLGVAIVLHDVTELRQLETMRRDFVANVSHELKTPLASIRAYAETLKLGAINDPENNLKFVKRIESQADILNQQIQDLIQLARVESARTAFEIIRIDLTKLCQRCVDMFVSKAESLEVELTLQERAKRAKRAEAVFIDADYEAIRTIVNNLISNALHYTPERGRVTVIISQTDRLATIEVADTGIGISAEHQSRIFERFYRVDKSRSRDMGGTGLGLAIVKHLAQAFEGSVELTSTEGEGSTFTIQFPLSQK